MAFHAIGNWRATGGLRSKEAYGTRFDPSEGYQFSKGFGYFGDERAARHGDHDVIRQTPAELFGNFVTVRLGAFGIVGTKIYVHEAPIEAVGDLSAEPIHMVVISVDAHDASAVNRG